MDRDASSSTGLPSQRLPVPPGLDHDRVLFSLTEEDETDLASEFLLS